MKSINYLCVTLLFVVFTSNIAQAQIVGAATDTIISEQIPISGSQALLPKKFLITQRLLWGEKGLMRNFNRFELNRENRNFEEDIRDKMLKAHRYVGYATLAGMVAQGIVGERLYRGQTDLKDLHAGLGAAVNIGYFTSAGLAFFTPPRMGDRPKGFSTYKLHKYLSIIHFSSMVATNILSELAEDNPKLKSAHRATAYVAYSSFFVSMVVIHF